MIQNILDNRVLLIPIGAWLTSQVLKVLINVWLERKVNLAHLFSAGGMPSSHSALVASVTMVIAFDLGVGSPLFGLSTIFAIIVMYDAAGVRRTVGTHARVLNRLLDELLVRHQINEDRLRELVGHTPLQVIAGAILGVVFTLIWVG